MYIQDFPNSRAVQTHIFTLKSLKLKVPLDWKWAFLHVFKWTFVLCMIKVSIRRTLTVRHFQNYLFHLSTIGDVKRHFQKYLFHLSTIKDVKRHFQNDLFHLSTIKDVKRHFQNYLFRLSTIKDVKRDIFRITYFTCPHLHLLTIQNYINY